MAERSEQMTIALTIALAVTVTYYGAALLWQYHKTRAYERAVQRRLNTLEESIRRRKAWREYHSTLRRNP